MAFSELTFAKLQALLLGVGFSERVIDGKFLGFYHADSDTLFTFRMYQSGDKVSIADIVTVRQQLAWRGLLGEDAFEAALGKVPA